MSAELPPPRPAATLLLVRDAPELQVLMVKRAAAIAFGPGALVFPGGKLDAGDHDPVWADHATGWAEIPADQRAHRIAAIREVYEDAGVLVARDAAGELFHGDEASADHRESVNRNERTFLGLVVETGLKLDLAALTLYAHWVPPAILAVRYDTRFFIAEAHSRQDAVHDGSETVSSEWIAPAEALRLADAGERELMFPTRMNLKLLAEAASANDAIARARARTIVSVTPRVEVRAEGRFLVLPPEAGYGPFAERLPDKMVRAGS